MSWECTIEATTVREPWLFRNLPRIPPLPFRRGEGRGEGFFLFLVFEFARIGDGDFNGPEQSASSFCLPIL